ncbi:hypothetical protein EI94DRAFT_1716573 [Lactarius quietus]|nr:hypothetical protein EI94DRAFT_1716573 [Lactarius quietus]
MLAAHSTIGILRPHELRAGSITRTGLNTDVLKYAQVMDHTNGSVHSPRGRRILQHPGRVSKFLQMSKAKALHLSIHFRCLTRHRVIASYSFVLVLYEESPAYNAMHFQKAVFNRRHFGARTEPGWPDSCWVRVQKYNLSTRVRNDLGQRYAHSSDLLTS